MTAFQQFSRLAAYYANRVGLAPRNRIFICSEIELRQSRPPRPPAGISVEVLSLPLLQQLTYCGGWLSQEEAIRKLRDASCWMVGAIRGDQLLGYTWGQFSVADVDFFDLQVPLPDDTVYHAHYFMRSDARDFFTAFALSRGFYAEAVRRGFCRTISYAVPGNVSTLILERLGATQYLTAHYHRLARWRRYRMRGADGSEVVTSARSRAAECMVSLGSRLLNRI